MPGCSVPAQCCWCSAANLRGRIKVAVGKLSGAVGMLSGAGVSRLKLAGLQSMQMVGIWQLGGRVFLFCRTGCRNLRRLRRRVAQLRKVITSSLLSSVFSLQSSFFRIWVYLQHLLATFSLLKSLSFFGSWCHFLNQEGWGLKLPKLFL